MTAYELPPNPKHNVWDRDDHEWTYDEFQGRYFCDEIQLRNRLWSDLIVEHGPLTDTRVPKVGEEFTISNKSENPFEYPDNSVYINDSGVVVQRRNDVFVRVGSKAHLPCLWEHTWRRIA